MDALPGRLGAAIAALEALGDPADRAGVLIDLADRFREVPPEIATRPFPGRHLVPACESEAYVWGVLLADGTMTLHFAVENPSGVSAKALAVILARGLSGLPPAEIARVSPDIVFDVFRRDISMGKGMGLMSMVRAVQTTARQAAEAGAPGIYPRRETDAG